MDIFFCSIISIHSLTALFQIMHLFTNYVSVCCSCSHTLCISVLLLSLSAAFLSSALPEFLHDYDLRIVSLHIITLKITECLVLYMTLLCFAFQTKKTAIILLSPVDVLFWHLFKKSWTGNTE